MDSISGHDQGSAHLAAVRDTRVGFPVCNEIWSATNAGILDARVRFLVCNEMWSG